MSNVSWKHKLLEALALEKHDSLLYNTCWCLHTHIKQIDMKTHGTQTRCLSEYTFMCQYWRPVHQTTATTQGALGDPNITFLNRSWLSFGHSLLSMGKILWLCHANKQSKIRQAVKWMSWHFLAYFVPRMLLIFTYVNTREYNKCFACFLHDTTISCMT